MPARKRLVRERTKHALMTATNFFLGSRKAENRKRHRNYFVKPAKGANLDQEFPAVFASDTKVRRAEFIGKELSASTKSSSESKEKIFWHADRRTKKGTINDRKKTKRKKNN